MQFMSLLPSQLLVNMSMCVWDAVKLLAARVSDAMAFHCVLLISHIRCSAAIAAGVLEP